MKRLEKYSEEPVEEDDQDKKKKKKKKWAPKEKPTEQDWWKLRVNFLLKFTVIAINNHFQIIFKWNIILGNGCVFNKYYLILIFINK